MRVWASVDIINASMLLRFEQQENYAANSVIVLTKQGSQLRAAVLKKAREETEAFRAGVKKFDNKDPPHYE